MGADSKKPEHDTASDDPKVGGEAEGEERRKQDERRKRPDQRKNIRFDEKGGDRRSGYARRETDEGIHLDDGEGDHRNDDD